MDNYDVVDTHLEPDILESEVRQALGSIAMNKTSGSGGIPAELFQILKDDAVKGLHSICQHIWKTQQWPQDWKRSVFIPIPKKGNVKESSNCQKNMLMPHTSKVCASIKFDSMCYYQNSSSQASTIHELRTEFRKGRGTTAQIASICWIIEKAREFQKTSTSASFTMLKLQCMQCMLTV